MLMTHFFTRRSETLRYLTQKTGKMRLSLILILMDQWQHQTAIMVIIPIITTITNIIIRVTYKIQDTVNNFTDLNSEDQPLAHSGSPNHLMVSLNIKINQVPFSIFPISSFVFAALMIFHVFSCCKHWCGWRLSEEISL